MLRGKRIGSKIKQKRKTFQTNVITGDITLLHIDRLYQTGVLLPQLESSVSPGRGETAYIFKYVGFVPQYPQTLCAFNTALCTVLVTTTSSSIFNYSQDQRSHIKHSFHPRICVWHWGPPCHLTILQMCPGAGSSTLMLPAPAFSHHSTCHICWEGHPKRERWFTEWKRIYKQWVIHIPSETEANLSSCRKEHKCQWRGFGWNHNVHVWTSKHDPLGQLLVYQRF